MELKVLTHAHASLLGLGEVAIGETEAEAPPPSLLLLLMTAVSDTCIINASVL